MTPKVKSHRRGGSIFRPAQSPLNDYLDGLSRTPKRLPCKLFYDDAGNRLFDQICALEEYYPTRTEFSILRENLEEISRLVGAGAAVVELGSGNPTKARVLLRSLLSPAAYVPIEISREQLLRSCEEIQEEFSSLNILPVCTDYTADLQLPSLPGETRGVLLFFPGSTLGNFEPIDALAFLLKLAHLSGKGTGLLIGIDLKKHPAVLEAAYNDARGVTAAFNLNILARANRELGADFQLDQYRHVVSYDLSHGRVVMQLESLRPQRVRLGSETVLFDRAERITTEYSYKYSIGEFQALARLAGFAPQVVWTDPEELFSLHYLTVE